MDNKVFLRIEFLNATEIYRINQNLIDWNYKEVIGESCYQKYTGHFAYVKIKISKSDNESCNLINNLTENEMPIPFMNEIVKTLNFFISYLSGLKGERINLNFEIIDGTFHQVDSRPTDFKIATLYAICNCFDKTLRQISDGEMQTIDNCKMKNKNYYS